MFVKRYLVNDMHEAMAKIKSELGDDAVILNSKQVRQKGIAGIFKKKKLEVVAAYESKIKKKPPMPAPQIDEPTFMRMAAPQPINNGASIGIDKIDSLNKKILELERTVKSFSERLDIPEGEQARNYSDEVLRMYQKMIEQDVDPAIAKELSEEVEKVTSKMEVEPSQVMQQLIVEKIGKPSPISLKKYKRNIIAFFGSTGVGKTTTLVKLAGQFVCEGDLKVGIINTDTYRVAAKEQLNIYADIMKIPIDTAYTEQELQDALKRQSDRDLILMDTAGRSTADEQYKKEIDNIIKTCEPDEIYVVLSLSTGYKTCRKIIDDLSFISGYKIILTKFDETGTWGNILNFTGYAKKPLAYITTGQNIPDDIQQADVSEIAANILGLGENI